jgi:hypothetical protein
MKNIEEKKKKNQHQPTTPINKNTIIIKVIAILIISKTHFKKIDNH